MVIHDLAIAAWKIEKETETDSPDNNKVSMIIDTLYVVINRMNTLEKYIRPPSKISVKELSTNDRSLTTTVMSIETKISTVLQVIIKKGIRMVIREKTYSMVKFLNNDQMATKMIKLSMKCGYMQVTNDWKRKGFKVHTKKHMYQGYSQI